MRLRSDGGWHRVDAGPCGSCAHLRHDSGAATVVAAMACCVLLVVTALALQVGAAAVARHRAQQAADAAALAGAARLLGGTELPCDAAAALAAANGARVSVCESDGADLLIETFIDGQWTPAQRSAVGRARAGPTADQWFAPGVSARADAAG